VEWAVFYPDGGNVLLDVSGAAGVPLTVRWLDIRGSQWVEGVPPARREDGDFLRLISPREEGYWAALIQV
jgi:hypothetical protein